MDLSILIPARNEQFLARTVQDILENIEGDTEVIVVLDGAWADPPIPDHPRVTILHHPVSIGQRAATNDAAHLSSAKYVMKVDAHCAFDKGFDVKMMDAMHDDWTMAPIMRNLHIFNWVCTSETCDFKAYQGPTPGGDPKKPICPKCGQPARRDIVWISKSNPQSKSYCFDSTPHFAYFREFNKRPEGRGDITPTMSLQGSCFMLTREKYWELDICGEDFGSWGSQGLEVACKTWLSGGQVMVNHKTYYSHAFRTQGGDWGFPYPLSGNQVERAKKHARNLFLENKWDKQVRPLSWLLEKFWPIPGWSDEDLAKVKATEGRFGVKVEPIVQPEAEPEPVLKPVPKAESKSIVYYTDNRIDPLIMTACQRQIEKSGLPIVSVSLKPLYFGRNIVLDLERGYLTMFKQILAGLEASTADIVYFCEHDLLYHPSHFDFVPPRKDMFYYGTNVWKVRLSDGHAMRTKDCRQTSGLCAYRELLLEHYRKRVAIVEEKGFSRNIGFEPATHGRPERIDDYKSDIWESAFPNIDIRHDKNLTSSRWSPDQFRNKRYTEGWQESDTIPGWGLVKGRMIDILNEIIAKT